MSISASAWRGLRAGCTNTLTSARCRSSRKHAIVRATARRLAAPGAGTAAGSCRHVDIKRDQEPLLATTTGQPYLVIQHTSSGYLLHQIDGADTSTFNISPAHAVGDTIVYVIDIVDDQGLASTKSGRLFLSNGGHVLTD